MRTEKDKMLSGELYDPLDPQLTAERIRARRLLKILNESSEEENQKRKDTLKELIPASCDDLWIQIPFYCDYGNNITIGERVFFNFNCIILDVAAVTIGNRSMFGPNVQIYAATHPMDRRARASGLEYGKPITIGDDVWVGGSVIICPGVTIGHRSVIGAGSVVTRDIPNDVFAAGNPCKVIRTLQPDDHTTH